MNVWFVLDFALQVLQRACNPLSAKPLHALPSNIAQVLACTCTHTHAYTSQGPAGSTALRLAPNTLVDSAGSTWSAPPAVAEAIQKVNAALRSYRTCLAGGCESTCGCVSVCLSKCMLGGWGLPVWMGGGGCLCVCVHDW